MLSFHADAEYDDRDDPFLIVIDQFVRQMELADPRDRWKHIGEPPPKPMDTPAAPRRPYTTPQSVVDAFWFVISLNDSDYLKRWLAQHPLDASVLYKLWEGKNARG
jgi:hypothetical protein